MIARLAFLTSPAPGRYMLNIQPFGTDDIIRFEIAQCHLANIVVDGASFALRESNRVPETKNQESANGDDRRQQPVDFAR